MEHPWETSNTFKLRARASSDVGRERQQCGTSGINVFRTSGGEVTYLDMRIGWRKIGKVKFAEVKIRLH